MKKKVLVLAHGFLGTAADWNFLTENSVLSDWIIIKLDLFNKAKEKETSQLLVPLNNWGKVFWSFILDELSKISVCKHTALSDFDIHLCGYSMGGRLLLHALKENPLYANKTILLSSSYGFFSDNDLNSKLRSIRREKDFEWAQKILACSSKDNFELFMQEWDSQDVFFNNKTVNQGKQKRFDFFSLHNLAFAIEKWGQAEQLSFLKAQIPWSKIFWFYGEYDAKYEKLLLALQADHPEASVEKINNAGHRVFFDNPKATSEKILEILFSK